MLLYCSHTAVVYQFPQSLQVCDGLIHQLRVTGNRLQPVENTITSSAVLLLNGLHILLITVHFLPLKRSSKLLVCLNEPKINRPLSNCNVYSKDSLKCVIGCSVILPADLCVSKSLHIVFASSRPASPLWSFVILAVIRFTIWTRGSVLQFRSHVTVAVISLCLKT